MNRSYNLLLAILFLFHFHLHGQDTLTEQYGFAVLDINNGLIHNQVNCFFKDSRGYVWIGTAAGLNRYDGHKFRLFRHDSKDSSSINGNNVIKIFEDPSGLIWVETASGYSLYNHKTERFSREWNTHLRKFSLSYPTVDNIMKDQSQHYWFIQRGHGLARYNAENKALLTFGNSPLADYSISTNDVAAIEQNSQGDYWILHRNGILELLDGKSFQVIEKNHFFYKRFDKELLEYHLTVDSDDDLWIYLTSEHRNGVFFYSSTEKTISHFHKDSPRGRLNTDLVTGIVEESEGIIWVGTDLGGINVINKKDFSVYYILHNGEDKNSLVHNSIYSLYKDNNGIIWIGAYKNGVNYYHKNIIKFQHHKYYASVPNSLPYDDVNRFVEDKNGNLWIGTNGGGLLYFDRKTGKYEQYQHDPDDPNSISSDVIVSLEITRKGLLLVGTYMGGLNVFDGKRFLHYLHDPTKMNSLPNDNVWELYEDSEGRIWVGVLNGGLVLFDPDQGDFLQYKPVREDNAVINSYVSAIEEDKEGNIWIGGNSGIDVIQKKSGEVIHFQNDPAKPESLIHNTIFWLHADRNNNMWIATEEGLDMFLAKENTFLHFTQEDGLPHNTVLTILEDKENSFWLSTRFGLSHLVLDSADNQLSYAFKNYDESDGLQGKVFNENAALATARGSLIFGGPNGYNIFYPELLEINENIPRIVFTDFQLFNNSIGIGETINGRVVFEKALAETNRIILKHNENFFSIELAALSFFQSEKCKYKYKLVGFDKDWHIVDNNNRRITYTNVDPGEYALKVFASNNDGLWTKKAESIQIAVLPPFWKTNQAYFIYALLILSILYVGRRIMLQRERMKFQIEQERREAKQLHELDLMKIRFFTNISHEFRTPLTLIISPLERLLSVLGEMEHQKQLQLIHRNAKRLLNLVNQLLDFRKIEVDGVKLHVSEGNIVKFIKESVHSFADLSEGKNIQLSFHANVEELHASFDMDKLEKILFNLLSNAFKFTPENGKIAVEVNCFDNESGSQDIKIVEFTVKDSGIGIPNEKQEMIFERFFRNDMPTSFVNQGSGIGLSITKEFVRIHGGIIKLTSTPNEGSSFTVSIPVRQLSSKPDSFSTDAPKEENVIFSCRSLAPPGIGISNGKKPVVLLVEDSEDFRFYLKDNLGIYFTIVEAKHGKEGWQKALSTMPDLIVSDLMMPELDGIDFCKKIRSDSRTSQIPFVLLTAHTTEEQKLKGLNIGANDYVTKPFNFELLLSRINNLINQKQLMQNVYERKISVDASDVEIVSLDDKMIVKAMKIVEENLSNPDFSVELLSKELGMSRANMYRKIMSITGSSPVEFIRKIRLQRAAQFLEKSQLTVAEVAYMVGFNNTKYFTKYFKNEFNVVPSMYAVSKGK